jgi:hypothetical protein
MSNAIKTYFLAPGWDLPVGSVQLGSVILDPSRPQRAFNAAHPPKIESTIHTSYKTNFTETVDRSKKRKIGLWAKFLEIFGLGSELSVQYDRGQVDKYSFKRMKTEWFLPSKDFMEKCVQTPEVVTFLEQTDYRKPVFMITGLKTIEGASVTTVRSKGRKLHGKLGFDGTSAAVPVSVGPEGEYVTNESETATFTNSSPIVFAFQLSRIVCKENEDLVQKEYTKGALFGADEDQEGGGVNIYEVEQTLEQGEGSTSVSVVDEEDDELH